VPVSEYVAELAPVPLTLGSATKRETAATTTMRVIFIFALESECDV
jgi:hypothetical protein